MSISQSHHDKIIHWLWHFKCHLISNSKSKMEYNFTKGHWEKIHKNNIIFQNVIFTNNSNFEIKSLQMHLKPELYLVNHCFTEHLKSMPVGNISNRWNWNLGAYSHSKALVISKWLLHAQQTKSGHLNSFIWNTRRYYNNKVSLSSLSLLVSGVGLAKHKQPSTAAYKKAFFAASFKSSFCLHASRWLNTHQLLALSKQGWDERRAQVACWVGGNP